MTRVFRSTAGVHTLIISSLLVFIALFVHSCSDKGNEPNGNGDDKNIYYLQNDDWAYMATTARNLDLAKDVNSNLNFACRELPFGYYRAMITECGAANGGHYVKSYCVFTLDQQFNVVGMMTPDDYYVTERQSGGYNFYNAKNNAEHVKANSAEHPMSLSRAETDFHLNIAESLINFSKYAEKYSTISTSNWAAMLERVKRGDTKSASECADQVNFVSPALELYEIDRNIREKLQPVVSARNYGISPLIDRFETVGEKLRVRFGFHTDKTSADDFAKVACGIIIYDKYDTTDPVWLPARDVKPFETEIEYDYPSLEFSDCKVAAYIINKEFISSSDPIIMHPDMVETGKPILYTSILPPNSITITEISSEEIIRYDPNGGERLIRVKGHASCDLRDGSYPAIYYAWISATDYANPDFSPSNVWEQERIYGTALSETSKDSDFDFCIHIDDNGLEKDYTNYIAKGHLIFFISDGGAAIGASDRCIWTYTRKPMVEFTQASIVDDHIFFKFRCDGSLWFDYEMLLDNNVKFSGNIKWVLQQSHNLLPSACVVDTEYEVSNPFRTALKFLFLDKTFEDAASVPDYAYIRYDICGDKHRSTNALKLKVESVVTGYESPGPFQDPEEVRELKITDVFIVP